MSFPPYPQHKLSGIEWLGNVPEHWDVLKLGHCLREPPCYGVLVPDHDPEGVEMLRINDLTAGVIDRGQLNRISWSLSTEYSRTIVEVGDVVLTVVGTIGVSAVIDQRLAKVNLSRAVARLQPSKRLMAHYAHWIFQSPQFRHYVDLTCVGTAQRVLNMGDLSAFVAALPPFDEQSRLASFLDRETAKIDALVEEQQRLIELLKEKRQAVITQAVTKGLNPNAPMKPSGIEWLGDVPAHWEVKPLKYMARLESGGTPSKDKPEYWEGDVPWASAKDLKSDRLSDTIDHITEQAIADGAASLVMAGSVLVLVRGMMLARTFPVVQTGVPTAINQDLKALVGREKVHNGFLAWLLRGTSAETLNRLDEAGHGTKALRMEAWTSMKLPLPPLAEQEKIAEYLDHLTVTADDLIEEVSSSTGLLNERRSALISAAGTGKIDVRGCAAEQEAA